MDGASKGEEILCTAWLNQVGVAKKASRVPGSSERKLKGPGGSRTSLSVESGDQSTGSYADEENHGMAAPFRPPVRRPGGRGQIYACCSCTAGRCPSKMVCSVSPPAISTMDHLHLHRPKSLATLCPACGPARHLRPAPWRT